MTESRPAAVARRAALVLEAVALLSVLACGVIIALAWGALPERVPQHFGAGGLPDSYGPRANITLPCIVAVAVYLVCSAAQLIPPRLYFMPAQLRASTAEARYRVARSLLRTVKAALGVMLAVGTWLTVQVALGHREGLGWAFLPATLLVTFAPLAWFGAKAYRPRAT